MQTSLSSALLFFRVILRLSDMTPQTMRAARVIEFNKPCPLAFRLRKFADMMSRRDPDSGCTKAPRQSNALKDSCSRVLSYRQHGSQGRLQVPAACHWISRTDWNGNSLGTRRERLQRRRSSSGLELCHYLREVSGL